jgi:hypothetical protein
MENKQRYTPPMSADEAFAIVDGKTVGDMIDAANTLAYNALWYKQEYEIWRKAYARDCAHNAMARSIVKRWLEWARAHGHIEHAEGIVNDTRELIAAMEGADR